MPTAYINTKHVLCKGIEFWDMIGDFEQLLHKYVRLRFSLQTFQSSRAVYEPKKEETDQFTNCSVNSFYNLTPLSSPVICHMDISK
jgi:hypothetical protein